MDKIIKFIALLFLLSGCANEPEVSMDNFKIIVDFTYFFSFDLNTKTLTAKSLKEGKSSILKDPNYFKDYNKKVAYENDNLESVYSDTISFSKDEIKEIYHSFSENKVASMVGDINTLEVPEFPSTAVQIYIYEKNKLKSTILYDEPLGKSGKEINRAWRFAKTLVKIIERKAGYKKMRKKISESLGESYNL